MGRRSIQRGGSDLSCRWQHALLVELEKRRGFTLGRRTRTNFERRHKDAAAVDQRGFLPGLDRVLSGDDLRNGVYGLEQSRPRRAHFSLAVVREFRGIRPYTTNSAERPQVVTEGACRALPDTLTRRSRHRRGDGTIGPNKNGWTPVSGDPAVHNVLRHQSVREGGLEPPCPLRHTDLNRARLPISPLARTISACAPTKRDYHSAEPLADASAREAQERLCTLVSLGRVLSTGGTGAVGAQLSIGVPSKIVRQTIRRDGEILGPSGQL